MKKTWVIFSVFIFLFGCGGGETAAPEESANGAAVLDKTTLEALAEQIEYAHVSQIEKLLGDYRNPSGNDEFLGSLLHTTVDKHNYWVTQLLVARGADVNYRDENGNTPLHMVETQLNRLKRSPWEEWKVLGHKIIELMVSKGADINSRNNRGQTPLHIYVYRYQGCAEQTIDLCVSHGADVNARDNEGYTPLDYAVDKDDRILTEALRKHGGRYSNPLRVEILNAARCGNTEKVKELIDKGADIESRTLGGLTTLHMASQYGREKIVKLLLDNGADIEAKTYSESTALNLAAYNRRKKVTELLINAGAELDTKDCHGRTPLHYASTYGYLETARILVEAGADVNVLDEHHRTPLEMAASMSRSDEICELLRRYGGKTWDELREKQ